MCILHNSIYNSERAMKSLTEKQQNPPIKVKMKIGDIEFEIEAQPDQIQTAVNQILTTVTDRLKKHQPRPTRRTPNSPPTSRNMQRRHPKTLGRKLVQRTPRLRGRPQRTRTKRLPLRQNSRSARTRGLGERQHAHTNRQTTHDTNTPKKTANISPRQVLISMLATHNYANFRFNSL